MTLFPNVVARGLAGRARACLGLVALAAGLAIASPAIAQGGTGTIKVVLQTQLKILDPVLTPAYSTRNHGYLIYDTLFAMDDKSQPQPQMVDTWTVSPDKLTYTFKLRAGQKFHDGTPVTGEDVIASLRRWSERDQMGARLMASTESLTSTDPSTFVFKLKRPYGLTIETLGKQGSPVPFIMPKRIASVPASQAITEAIGSGPYKFVAADFQPGVKSTYLKNTDYVPRKETASAFAGGKIAMADRIEVVSIPDVQTAVQALRTGEVDFVEDVQPDLMAAARGRQGHHRQVVRQAHRHVHPQDELAAAAVQRRQGAPRGARRAAPGRLPAGASSATRRSTSSAARCCPAPRRSRSRISRRTSRRPT